MHAINTIKVASKLSLYCFEAIPLDAIKIRNEYVRLFVINNVVIRKWAVRMNNNFFYCKHPAHINVQNKKNCSNHGRKVFKRTIEYHIIKNIWCSVSDATIIDYIKTKMVHGKRM